MDIETNQEYLLGTNQQELDRLRFQHTVWKPVTENFFDRLKVSRGWHCLDAGAGPGFVAMDLCERVGAEGSVTTLEPSVFYLEWFREQVHQHAWTNVESIQGIAETTKLPDEHFDLIFLRWVVSFVPDVERLLLNLIRSLKPGGIIALQDYYYEGISLYPHGSFNLIFEVMRTYYRASGGDPYVAALIPGLFRKHNIDLIECSPHCLAGGPESGVAQWAGQFFIQHVPIIAEKGLISGEARDAILNDWNEHRQNPDMLFFSPLVVDIAGVKPR